MSLPADLSHIALSEHSLIGRLQPAAAVRIERRSLILTVKVTDSTVFCFSAYRPFSKIFRTVRHAILQPCFLRSHLRSHLFFLKKTL